jgi:hypothetical protein
MFNGKPWYLYMLIYFMIPSFVMILLVEIKCATFVNWSTQQNWNNRTEHGRSTMKSIEGNNHGLSKTGSDCNKPYGWWCGVFLHAHISHMWMNSFTNFHICGHLKFVEINSMFLLIPKHHIKIRSWCIWRTCSCARPNGT